MNETGGFALLSKKTEGLTLKQPPRNQPHATQNGIGFLTASGPSAAIWGGWLYSTPAACACNLVCIHRDDRNALATEMHMHTERQGTLESDKARAVDHGDVEGVDDDGRHEGGAGGGERPLGHPKLLVLRGGEVGEGKAPPPERSTREAAAVIQVGSEPLEQPAMTPETVADSDWLNSGGGGGGLSLSLRKREEEAPGIEGGGASRFSFFARSCARLTKRLAGFHSKPSKIRKKIIYFFIQNSNSRLAGRSITS
jgi:hypothetical protein